MRRWSASASSGSCIQLLAPLTPESTIAKFLDRNGQGIQQLAFRVEDVEHVATVLRERGLRLLYDAPRRGTSDSRVNFIHPKDAGGVLVELVEPGSRRRHPVTGTALSRASVTSMCPGAWEIASGGRDSMTAACGVTPQAQNTGTSPSRTAPGRRSRAGRGR